MKTKLGIAFFLVIFSLPAICQNSKFNGEWKINREKSALDANQLFLSKISIQVKGDSLLSTRVYESPDGQEYPFDENVSLNGKDYKITIYDMPRVSKAQNNGGSINFESKTTFYGDSGEENLIAKETWKVDNEGKTLTMDVTNQMSGQESKATNIYEKTK